jgi:CRISPR system Cascade subunit CasC
MELTAGLFYGYVVVDVPGLVSNLEGCSAGEWQDADRTLASQVVENLLHLVATVTPGAKLGSTAPYACADLMLVEAGSRQPRSLANAYRDPARPRVEDAIARLSGYLGKLDGAYGCNEGRRVMSVEECDIPGAERLGLDDLAAWASQAVRDAEAGQP